MLRRPPRSTRTDTLLPYTTLFRSRPTFVGQFGTNEYYYVSRETRQLAFARPRPIDQQVLRIRFDEAGNVAAVDRTGLELVSKISPERDNRAEERRVGKECVS